ncbi:MAG TPA: lysozyme [Vicinamibacterales bacterium]
MSKNGIALVKAYEGCELKAYADAIGVITIGYGHTGQYADRDAEITQVEADRILLEDLAKFERGVENLVKAKISQNQFDALVAFAFNLGLGNLKSSTLLKKVNSGDKTAVDEFAKWTRAGGKVLPGLVKRRAAEAALFQGKPWAGP